MSFRNSLFVLGILLMGCQTGQKAPEEVASYHNPDALVEAQELMERLGEDRFRVVDFRKPEDYQSGHIPGAISLWRSDIEDPEHPLPGMIASRKHMESLLSLHGISDRETLVIYDAHASCDAARLWWVLKVYGFNRVRLLNGGLHAWKAAGGTLSAEKPQYPATVFRFTEPGVPLLRIEADSLNELLENESCVLIDARSREEYSGYRQKSGAKRAGKIPGSYNVDWAAATHYGKEMTFKSPEELKRIYAFLPADSSLDVVTYCHSGVRSAHTSFVLSQLLGYPRVRNYDGSWLEWSALEQMPIITDTKTIIFE
jgi:thiosulfate/3-mercaptopyruvate sulfurtransferase